MPDNPPLIEYALPDTQFGVITEPLPDGGVRLILRDTFSNTLRSLLLRDGSNNHSSISFWSLINNFIAGDAPVRALLTLGPDGFGIHEPNRTWEKKNFWPLIEIDHLHIADKQNGIELCDMRQKRFILLQDLNRDVMRYVGELLERKLAELRNKALPKT